MNFQRSRLEVDSSGGLGGATSSDAVDAALTTAEGGGDVGEVAITQGTGIGIRDLRGAAELEGFDAGFDRGFAKGGKACEEGEIVLNVAGPAELVAPGVTGDAIADWLREGGGIEPCAGGSGSAAAVQHMVRAGEVGGLGGPGVLSEPLAALTMEEIPETIETMPEAFQPPRAYRAMPELKKGTAQEREISVR